MRRLRLAFPFAFLAFLADCTTKEMAQEYLAPEHVAHPVVGDVVQFTLAYNDGAAMGLPLGPYDRSILIALGLVIVAVLLRVVLKTPRAHTLQQAALGLLLGGAIGNLAWRMMSERGVVDFIDIGIGRSRFYIFNVADVMLWAGVILFVYSSYRAEQRATPSAAT